MDGAIKATKGRCIEKSDQEGIRKGPWSVEEDTILVNYVATHGDRLWTSLARSSGLKRSGKSCRLRWLNYLRPNVRRGNITLQEQITILDLHSQWGNRWSKIAQHLPGRTDNEIKNYWRTRVSKLAKQLNCDVNSKKFRDALRYVWMPLLLERVQPPSKIDPSPSPSPTESAGASAAPHQHGLHLQSSGSGTACPNSITNSSSSSSVDQLQQVHSDSGHSVSSDQTGQNDPGLCPSFNSQMFEYTATTATNSPLVVASGDLLLESLWSDENIWGLPPLCDDLGIKDNFLA